VPIQSCHADWPVFHYLAGIGTEATLEQAWQQADLGPTPAQIRQGIVYLGAEKADWPNRWQKSAYSLQGAYRGFLAAVELREETIPHHDGGERARGEIVFYNLGKFSQVITDYEAIHFHTKPADLYAGFSGYLVHNAPDYYPEGWEDAGFAQPDAVQVMTVHRAKGTEFPVAFLPNLVKNRFPATRQGGRKWSSVLPEAAVVGGHRLNGGEDENSHLLDKIGYAEKSIELKLADGVVVHRPVHPGAAPGRLRPEYPGAG
jgi:Superfamily I DNA and RNA helicases